MATFDLLGGIRRIIGDGGPALPQYRTKTRNPIQIVDGYSRSPVYQAERRVRAKISQPWVFRDIMEVQLYAYNLLARVTEYDRASWPVTFEEGEDGRATYQSGKIVTPLPVVQMTILHELAHHLTNSNHDDNFIQAYVYLLRMEMGEDIAQKLLDELP